MPNEFWVSVISQQLNAIQTGCIITKLRCAPESINLEEIGRIDMSFLDEIRDDE